MTVLANDPTWDEIVIVPFTVGDKDGWADARVHAIAKNRACSKFSPPF
jgi:hypothetical protein